MKKNNRNNLLELIVRKRRDDAYYASTEIPVSELESLARKRVHRSLTRVLKGAKEPCIIAEMKRASPSAGMLCVDYEPGKIARIYEESGAKAVSVLTEPHHFQGDIKHIRDVRRTIGLPIMRKDFISDSYQVFESAAWGADIILLIVSVLDSFLMKDLYQQALESNLEVLIESHSREELETAAEYQDAVLGVNNRNLKTMETDLSIGHELAEFVPPGRMTVIESGIKTRAEVIQFWELGYKGFLIGKALMRSDSPGQLLHDLAGR